MTARCLLILEDVLGWKSLDEEEQRIVSQVVPQCWVEVLGSWYLHI